MNVSGGAWSRLRKALQERRAQRDAKRLSASRIDQAVESIVDASNPRIRAVSGYRKILRPIAERNGKTVAQLAIAWVLRRPELTAAIVGARKPSQIDDTVKAGNWELAENDISEIDALLAKREQALA